MLIIRGNSRVANIYLGEFMHLYRHFAFRDWLTQHPEADEVQVGHLDESDQWKHYFGDSFESQQRSYFGKLDLCCGELWRDEEVQPPRCAEVFGFRGSARGSRAGSGAIAETNSFILHHADITSRLISTDPQSASRNRKFFSSPRYVHRIAARRRPNIDPTRVISPFFLRRTNIVGSAPRCWNQMRVIPSRLDPCAVPGATVI
jgi:hypothetical protein